MGSATVEHDQEETVAVGTKRSGRLRVRVVLLVLAALALVGTAGTAWAADASSIAGVRDALSSNPVYVAPDAEGASLVDADALRRSIGDAPIVVAVLPTQARQAAPGGSVDALPEAIGGRRAVVVLCGRSLRAGSSSSVLPAGRAGELAREAQRDHNGAFDRSDVQGALTELVTSLRSEMASRGSGGSGGGSAGGSSGSGGNGGTPVWPWVLGGLVVVGGGAAAYAASRRRRRAQEAQQRLDTARAEVSSLYSRLGSDVSTIDPGSDPVARQAMSDASERYTEAGALLSRASSPGEVAAAGAAAAEGLHAARDARQRLGLELGPPIPEPQRDRPALDRPREVQVGQDVYQGYPTYAPGAPYYFPGGTIGGGYVPGGWYGSRFWQGALAGGLAGAVLTGGLGGFGFGGFGWGGGWGGYGSGYGLGYGSGYDSGYEAGLERGDAGNGGDWSGDGGAGGGDWGGDGGAGGGDWGGGGDVGGGDWGGGGDFGGGDFGGGGDSGGGSW